MHDYILNGYSSKEIHIQAYSYLLFTHDDKCYKFRVYIQLRKCVNFEGKQEVYYVRIYNTVLVLAILISILFLII